MGDMADYYTDHTTLLEDEEEEMSKALMKQRPVRKTQTQKQAEVIAANKFYVGSHRALDNRWGHKTLPAAIKHAEQLMDEQEQEFMFVVEIVRVVRRRRLPAQVVKV